MGPECDWEVFVAKRSEFLRLISKDSIQRVSLMFLFL